MEKYTTCWLPPSSLSTQTISNNPLPRNWRVASFPKRATIRCASLTGKTSLGWLYGLLTCDLWGCSMVMTCALFHLFGGLIIDQCSHDAWVPDMFLLMDGWMLRQRIFMNFQKDSLQKESSLERGNMLWSDGPFMLLLFLVNHGMSNNSRKQRQNLSGLNIKTRKGAQGPKGFRGWQSDTMPLLWQATGHTSCAPNVANLACDRSRMERWEWQTWLEWSEKALLQLSKTQSNCI